MKPNLDIWSADAFHWSLDYNESDSNAWMYADVWAMGVFVKHSYNKQFLFQRSVVAEAL